jgi:hypothetical protein
MPHCGVDTWAIFRLLLMRTGTPPSYTKHRATYVSCRHATSWTGEPIYLNGTVTEDPAIDEYVSQFSAPIQALLDDIVGETQCTLTSSVILLVCKYTLLMCLSRTVALANAYLAMLSLTCLCGRAVISARWMSRLLTADPCARYNTFLKPSLAIT